MVWKKTKLNNESGICPNLTFEDDEFKEDNKALNDQGEELMLFWLFIFNLFKLSFNFFNITSIGFVNIKKNLFAGTRVILETASIYFYT
jgi:hypothetical protein